MSLLLSPHREVEHCAWAGEGHRLSCGGGCAGWVLVLVLVLVVLVVELLVVLVLAMVMVLVLVLVRAGGQVMLTL